jgi:hypothetical protein
MALLQRRGRAAEPLPGGADQLGRAGRRRRGGRHTARVARLSRGTWWCPLMGETSVASRPFRSARLHRSAFSLRSSLAPPILSRLFFCPFLPFSLSPFLLSPFLPTSEAPPSLAYYFSHKCLFLPRPFIVTFPRETPALNVLGPYYYVPFLLTLGAGAGAGAWAARHPDPGAGAPAGRGRSNAGVGSAGRLPAPFLHPVPRRQLHPSAGRCPGCDWKSRVEFCAIAFAVPSVARRAGERGGPAAAAAWRKRAYVRDRSVY